MSVTDELLRNAESYAASFHEGDLAVAPARALAVVACMDSRLNLYPLLGLRNGDAHLIRNAGGVITDDAIRSLTISQHLLGTQEIVLVHHTDCGLLKVTEESFKGALLQETGVEPAWDVEAFDHVDESVRRSMARIHASPFIPHKNVRGFVYQVEDGHLREVR
jgi:carbonic anhydrase